MALLVEYKCDQTIPSIYQLYQAFKDKDNVIMQDIIISERQRERAIANTGDLYRSSSTLALRPRLQHYEGFPLESIPPDHSVPQHLKGVPTRTLGLSSPSLVPEHTASPQARRGRTSNKEFTLEPEKMRTHTSASSKYKKELLVI